MAIVHKRWPLAAGMVRPVVTHLLLCIASAQTGATPLHAATARGHVDVVRLLLRRGAAVGVTDMVSVPAWAPERLAFRKDVRGGVSCTPSPCIPSAGGTPITHALGKCAASEDPESEN